MQIHLSNTTETLELETSSTSAIHYKVGYTDITSSGVSNPSASRGIISSATTTTILSAPSASTTRKIQYVNIYNAGTSSNTVKIKEDVSGTENISLQAILRNNETLRIVNDQVSILDASGLERKQGSEVLLNSDSKWVYKVGTTSKGPGIMYCFSKDTGFPGSYTIGTPGVNGRNTDGTTSTDSGCINNGNASSGLWYLRDFDISTSTQGQVNIFDMLWINTGLVVTTTTAQSITQPTLPARDFSGTTNGEGVNCGILVTTATTNASAITNMTISYTNSSGTAGRTGTISSFPATSVIGTFVPFQLQSGDTGIRSIQSITLGTSLVSGAISLICFTNLMAKGNIATNSGSSQFNKVFDIPLYNGHCLMPFILPSAATATTINGTLYFVNK